jgi:GT2 family glycosyltransferase/glycosyltransferase involved in cell wall biosynthesis
VAVHVAMTYLGVHSVFRPGLAADSAVRANLAGTVRQILAFACRARDALTEFALTLVLNDLECQDPARALSHLEYAQRLAPADGGITLAVGIVRLALGDPRAVESLKTVADRTGRREVIVLLANARRFFGDTDGAAAELHRTLARNAPDLQAGFVKLITAVARNTGAAGWCGLDNAGQLTIGGAAVDLPEDALAVSIDGRPIRLRGRHPRSWRGMQSFRLADSWEHGQRLEVSAKGRPLMGSPVSIREVTRVEGFVQAEAGGITGWCWLPGEPETNPRITVCGIVHPERRLRATAREFLSDLSAFSYLAAPRRFAFSLDEIATLESAVRVQGPHGQMLYGSPLDPCQTLVSALSAAAVVRDLFPAGPERPSGTVIALHEPSIPVNLGVQKPAHPAPRLPRPVSIIIPVHRGLQATVDCVQSVLAARSLPDEQVLAVIDASPEPELVQALQDMAASGRITLSLQTENRGFPATANIGLRLAQGRDVVLLNSDTLTPPGWLERLQAAVYSADDIGTATPLSNDASIFSYPLTNTVNPPPDLDEVTTLSAHAAAANGGVVVEVPTAHGFCMYIRAECLADTGVLREDVFGQGYGEENDFCLRAHVFGWRHVAVPSVFVGHIGSQSFTAARKYLLARNLGILNRLHVGYDGLIRDWLAADPLAEARRRLDLARFAAQFAGRRMVALVSHDREGGVLRHVHERAASYGRKGDCAVILRPDRDPGGRRLCRVVVGDGGAYPNLLFRMPEEAGVLRAFLRASWLRFVEIHHFIGHDQAVLDLARDLGVPYTVYLHDYSWFCPRVTLTSGADHRHCGEPPVASCHICGAEHGTEIEEEIGAVALRARSAALFAGARKLIAPSADCARRMERQLGFPVTIKAWEPGVPLRLRAVAPIRQRRRRICVVGALNYDKGYETLLQCARLVAERDLPLEFALVGFTCNDRMLLQTGPVTITGHYEEAEAVDLIRAQRADIGFLPASWPETWSYVLTQMWEASLPVLAYDIGAPAERIRASRGGVLVPVHMPLPRLVALLLHPRLFVAPAMAVCA